MTEIRTDDGCTLNLRSLRESTAQTVPILFIHALGMNGTMWGRVADRMKTDTRMIGLDCRGHGDSDKPAGPYTTERFARDIGNVLDALQWPTALIAGCSMGGTVAQAFAGRHPERCAGLVLADTTSWYGEGAAAAWDTRAINAERQGFAAMTDFQTERWFASRFNQESPDVVQNALGIFQANDMQAYGATCRMLGNADERERIGNYRGPVAVLVGDQDMATPVAMAQDIVSRIPGATLNVLPEARHFTPIEAPVPIAAIIDALFRDRVNKA